MIPPLQLSFILVCEYGQELVWESETEIEWILAHIFMLVQLALPIICDFFSRE